MSRKKARRPTPRDWVRNHAFPWPAPDALTPGDDVAACYAITAVQAVPAPGGDAVIRLTLAEARGALEAWLAPAILPAERDWLRTGAYVGIRGPIHRGETGTAVQVEKIGPVEVELDDLSLFLPSSSRDSAEMEAELLQAISSVQDPALSALLALLLGPDSEIGAGFRLAPAATRFHHAYLGGLLEHTLSVTHLCDAMAGHYGERIDRDLLITAALLHDVGKVREIGAQEGFPYTEEGRLLGHIVLGLQMVADAAREVADLAPERLLTLQHMIAAHQGRYEWQSPREPRTAEALLLHYADDLDAKLNRAPRQTSGPGVPTPAPPSRPPFPAAATPEPKGKDRGTGATSTIRDDDTIDMFA